jgi:hypothetical protein
MSHELSVFYFCLFSVLSHLSHDLIAFPVAQPPLSVSFRFFRSFRRDIAFLFHPSVIRNSPFHRAFPLKDELGRTIFPPTPTIIHQKFVTLHSTYNITKR